jgi:hypothetical protein
VREALTGAFFVALREGVAKLGREGSGFEGRGLEGAGVAGCLMDARGPSRFVVGYTSGASFEVAPGVPISGGSEDGGSEPKPGLNGVRKGDLNGFCSVLVASFSRRRFACGVDIFAGKRALRVRGDFAFSRVRGEIVRL